MSEASPAAEELEQLMALYQEANTDAAGTLVARLGPQILGFYISQVRERPMADDLLQDFWLRLHKARHTYRRGEPLLPWVYSIARRVLIDHYRRNKRIRDHELQTEHVPETSEYSFRREPLPAMGDLLKTLPPAQREVIVLLKVRGFSLEEVARTTGSSVGAVKQKAFRGYQALRKLFGSEQ
jgi:RNA polymerase sigma-70 factor, ECF subfamily